MPGDAARRALRARFSTGVAHLPPPRVLLLPYFPGGCATLSEQVLQHGIAQAIFPKGSLPAGLCTAMLVAGLFVRRKEGAPSGNNFSGKPNMTVIWKGPPAFDKTFPFAL